MRVLRHGLEDDCGCMLRVRGSFLTLGGWINFGLVSCDGFLVYCVEFTMLEEGLGTEVGEVGH